jgi:hypothetical protein
VSVKGESSVLLGCLFLEGGEGIVLYNKGDKGRASEKGIRATDLTHSTQVHCHLKLFIAQRRISQLSQKGVPSGPNSEVLLRIEPFTITLRS